jgi:hypothetical protein
MADFPARAEIHSMLEDVGGGTRRSSRHHIVDDETYFTQGNSAKRAATAAAAAATASRRYRMTGPSFRSVVARTVRARTGGV